MTLTIEAKRLPIFGLAGHLYFEIWDEAGNRVTQINGLATTQDGRIIPVGSDEDITKDMSAPLWGVRKMQRKAIIRMTVSPCSLDRLPMS